MSMKMKGISIYWSFTFDVLMLLIILFIHGESSKAADHDLHQTAAGNDGVYIVYMGSSAAPSNSNAGGSLRHEHAQLLTSLLKRKANAVLHTYRHGFSGFAARLSEEEAISIAQEPGVVSVFPDPLLKLHTTHSWDFLNYSNINYIPPPTSTSSSSYYNGSAVDTIIGILDTGIWPESESFNDKDMGPIPSRWKGTCMEGHDFTSSNCNRKLIGARFYDDSDESDAKKKEERNSARDWMGHGTHVAGTAAGSIVDGASYYGLAAGTAKGGSPGSRIAMYKVCSSTGGCLGSTTLRAFDDAIRDHVDVLSLSLGSPANQSPDLTDDPIAIGAFHAVEQGITVLCSAGNDGPSPATVSNVAPWILTVAASTIDRIFESDVVLGGNKVIKGIGINFSTLGKSPVHPVTYTMFRQCDEKSLKGQMMKGKIVMCDTSNNDPQWTDKMEAVKSVGGIGVIFVNDDSGEVSPMAITYGPFLPATAIGFNDAQHIISYINSTRNPVATILPTVTVTKYKPAPAVAYFSSRGPSYATNNILKPDIAAPGVDIVAAWKNNDTTDAPEGKGQLLFNVLSGTSMACPHVSAIAATIKYQYPTWTPSAIRSAIMTTATQMNNLGAPITTDSGSIATPYDYGAGEVLITGPLQPGLVYETDTIDYLNYLCYFGYNTSQIKTIAKTIPDGFACPKDFNADYISHINSPSIAISKLNGKQSKTVTRKVTNVAGDGEIVFTAIVDAPSDLSVKVIPNKLQFSKNNQKLSYQVVFSLTTSSSKEDKFGSVTWSNEIYKVRSPFVVSI